jgi:hypothetical protein
MADVVLMSTWAATLRIEYCAMIRNIIYVVKWRHIVVYLYCEALSSSPGSKFGKAEPFSLAIRDGI